MRNLLENKEIGIFFKKKYNKFAYWLLVIIISIVVPWIIFRENPLMETNSSERIWSRFTSILVISLGAFVYNKNKK
ncbi:hypothetical protein QJR26_09715 [Clostridium baratii]